MFYLIIVVMNDVWITVNVHNQENTDPPPHPTPSNESKD